MDRWLLGLVAGLLGGVGGALAVHLFLGQDGECSAGGPPTPLARQEAHADGAAAPTLEARPEDTLAARLDRIERLLEGGPASSRQGRADAATDPAALALVRKAVGEELEARLGALQAEGAASKARDAEPKKKRVTLSEAARELDLTSTEEAELRRIYAESQEKYLKIVAGPDGDVETLRREVEEAKRDPKKGQVVMAKYLPKMLPRIGEFLQVNMDEDAAIQAAVGPDKAARLDGAFDVIEANPLGAGSEMRIEANAR